MRRAVIVVSLAAVAALATAPSASAKRCDPRWFHNVYSVTEAVNMSCPAARSVVRRHVTGLTARFRLGPFTCDDYGGALQWRCRDGSRSFRFRTVA